ncbi:unnamed protein product [Symbiodinium pilosum]|uniref:Uncharacterized protein n=1 Tax=Symbiodinium pilosum TaxID=2952 RepID=A0A812S6Z5_SYMPI|nr:unnamed protein product [Symbiodinium pilosum]
MMPAMGSSDVGRETLSGKLWIAKSSPCVDMPLQLLGTAARMQLMYWNTPKTTNIQNSGRERGHGLWNPCWVKTKSSEPLLRSVLLFRHGLARISSNEIEFGGAQCQLKPGLESSLDEVYEIRKQLSDQADALLDKVASRDESAGPDSDFGFTDEVILRALNFLGSPKGDFLVGMEECVAGSDGAAEEVGLGILTLLGRTDAASVCGGHDGQATAVQKSGGYKDALSGRMVPTARPWLRVALGRDDAGVKEEDKTKEPQEVKAKVETTPEPEPDSKREREVQVVQLSEERCIEDWATGMVQAALLAVLKRRAAAAEAFDVAARLKARELGAQAVTSAGRERALQLLAASKLASVEQLHVRKRKAVELEDYELAGSIKREVAVLEAEIQAANTDEMLGRVREQAVRIAAAPKHRKRLLKAAGADALRVSGGSEGDLWEEVGRRLRTEASGDKNSPQSDGL